jgi:hypothetical protein
VLRDVALGIRLDQEVDKARLVIAGNRGVRSDNFLDGSIRLRKVSANGDVLADGKAKNASGRRELESVAKKRLAVRQSGETLFGAAGETRTYMATL